MGARILYTASKIADGDVQGTIRLLSSEETIAPQHKEPLKKLLVFCCLGMICLRDIP